MHTAFNRPTALASSFKHPMQIFALLRNKLKTVGQSLTLSSRQHYDQREAAAHAKTLADAKTRIKQHLYY